MKQIRRTSRDIRNAYSEYENFVNAYLEAAAECIPIKQGAKPRLPWETLAVRKKRADVKPLPYAIGGTQPISETYLLGYSF